MRTEAGVTASAGKTWLSAGAAGGNIRGAGKIPACMLLQLREKLRKILAEALIMAFEAGGGAFERNGSTGPHRKAAGHAPQGGLYAFDMAIGP